MQLIYIENIYALGDARKSKKEQSKQPTATQVQTNVAAEKIDKFVGDADGDADAGRAAGASSRGLFWLKTGRDGEHVGD